MATRKTARQKAQDELDLATRVFEKAEARAKRANEDLDAFNARHEKIKADKENEAAAANAALKDAKDRKDFLATHPALKGSDQDALL